MEHAVVALAAIDRHRALVAIFPPAFAGPEIHGLPDKKDLVHLGNADGR